jgi:hypothetical protein
MSSKDLKMNMKETLEKIHDSFDKYITKVRGEGLGDNLFIDNSSYYFSGITFSNCYITLTTPGRVNYDGKIIGALKIEFETNEPGMGESLTFAVSADGSQVFSIINQTLLIPIEDMWEGVVSQLIDRIKEKNESYRRVADNYLRAFNDVNSLINKENEDGED